MVPITTAVMYYKIKYITKYINYNSKNQYTPVYSAYAIYGIDIINPTMQLGMSVKSWDFFEVGFVVPVIHSVFLIQYD